MLYEYKWEITGLIIIVLFLMFIGYHLGKVHGYKDGQVDAINDVIKYELVTNIDKTVEWKWKK